MAQYGHNLVKTVLQQFINSTIKMKQLYCNIKKTTIQQFIKSIIIIKKQ